MNALSRRPLVFRPLVPVLRPDSDLPQAAPLAMPVQALDEHAMRRRRMTPQTARSGRAVLLVAATLVLTGPAVAGLGTALRIDGLTGLDRQSGVEAVVETHPGVVTGAVAYPVVGAGRWRLIFDLDLSQAGLAPAAAVNLRAFLRHAGGALTETWSQQVFAA